MDEPGGPHAQSSDGTRPERDNAGSDADWEAFRVAWTPYVRAYMTKDSTVLPQLDTMVWDVLVNAFMEGYMEPDDPRLKTAIQGHARRIVATHKRLVRHEVPLDAIRDVADATEQELDPASGCTASRGRIEQLLRRLPEQQRHVASLRLNGLKHDEVALHLGIEGAHVRKLWQRAVDNLRRELLTFSAPPGDGIHRPANSTASPFAQQGVLRKR